MTERGAHLAAVALVGGALAIGFAPIFVRLADVGPTAAAFWRLALAAPVLCLLWIRWPGHRDRSPGAGSEHGNARWDSSLVWPGVFFAGDLAVWHQAIHLTSVANATLLANLQPAVVALVSVVWFGLRLGRGFWGGLSLALAGAVILLSDSLTLSADHVVGDVLGIVTAGFYAGYILAIARARRGHGVVPVMAAASTVGAVLLLPAALASGEVLLPTTPAGWWPLIGLAGVSHVLGQGLIAWSLRHLPTHFSSVSLLIQPVAAAVYAWWLLAEPFGPVQAAGGAVVLLGVWLCRRASTRTT